MAAPADTLGRSFVDDMVSESHRNYRDSTGTEKLGVSRRIGDRCALPLPTPARAVACPVLRRTRPAERRGRS